ncbi:MAG: nitrite/sulfite reductase [Gammaproteobacteria bacterium]
MYQYNHNDSKLLTERARQFAGQVRRFQAGALDPELFQQLRLRNGLYRERYAHMLRVAIPYGVLNGAQLRKLAEIARDFDRGFGHFTTRQNIQFNWPELERVPEILARLAEVGMHAIQTSGSCMRNITADHLAGAAADEVEDPRPWCELIRQWATLHPEFNWLPRKFKIAASGAHADRAAIQWHDIGLRIHHDAAGRARFRVYVGGGMGRIPVIGKVIEESLAGADLLAYLHAILRVYNLHGRRDHKYRSRIKILVNDLGIDAFRAKVAAEWRRARDTAPRLSDAEIARAKSFFAKPPARAARAKARVIPVADSRFLRWREHNTSAHRDPRMRIVHISLKAPGMPPGDLDAAQMDELAQLAEDYAGDEIRVSHEQNLALPHVATSDLFALWRELCGLRLATPNIGTLNDMICCPGLDYCSLANAGTIPIAKQINARLSDLDRLYDIGEVKLKMSGCMNACGHHHAGHIGILGVDKKGEEWYQITLGGSAGNDASLGGRLGPAIARDQVAACIETLLETYLDLRLPGEKFIDCVRRAGIAPFRESVYADHQKSPDHRESVAA